MLKIFSGSKNPGLFCVFEGIDGGGKSTLVKNLGEALLAHKPLILREPTDFDTGKKIRQALLSKKEDRKALLKLFMDDRKANLKKNVEPAKKNGRLILQDRYFYSTAAYQGTNDDVDEILASNRKSFPEPDILFFLEISPELAVERLQTTREKLTVFESIERLQRIKEMYDRILPAWTVRLQSSMHPAELVEICMGIILSQGSLIEG